VHAWLHGAGLWTPADTALRSAEPTRKACKSLRPGMKAPCPTCSQAAGRRIAHLAAVEAPTSQVDEDCRPQLGIAEPCEPRRQSHGQLASRDRAIRSRGHLQGRGHGQEPDPRPVALLANATSRVPYVCAGRFTGGLAPRLATSGRERMRCHTKGLVCRVSPARARRRARLLRLCHSVPCDHVNTV